MSTSEEYHDEKLYRIDLCNDNLIHAAAQGNVTSSLLWLGQINVILHQRQDFPSSIGSSNQGNGECKIYPLDMKAIKYAFCQNDQRRSAFHHAACNGHHNLVEYFLSLYLIFAIKISFDSIHNSQSFRSWFLDLNTSLKNTKEKHKRYDKILLKQKDEKKASFVFSLKDYDQCMMQSKNQKVVNVMVKKNIDVAHAMRIVEQASFSCVPYIALIQPRMKKIYLDVKRVIEKKKRRNILKPVLVYDDENDVRELNYQDDDLSYDDSDAISLDRNDYSSIDADSCFSCDKEDFVVVKRRANDSSNPTSVYSTNDELDIVEIEVELVNDENVAISKALRDKFISHPKRNRFNNFKGLMNRAFWISTPLRDSTNTSTKSQIQPKYTGKYTEPPLKDDSEYTKFFKMLKTVNNASQGIVKSHQITEKDGGLRDQGKKCCYGIDMAQDFFHVREGKRYILVKGLKRSRKPE